MIFVYPKWLWFEMARNSIKSDFWASKMVASDHFAKKLQKIIEVLIWNGEQCNTNNLLGHPKWLPPVILWNCFKTIKVAFILRRWEMLLKWFSGLKNGLRRHFVSKKWFESVHNVSNSVLANVQCIACKPDEVEYINSIFVFFYSEYVPICLCHVISLVSYSHDFRSFLQLYNDLQ